MSDSDSFVHLHVHSEYSMLDGAARLSDLVAETAAQGMPAVAVTDHGNMFGAFEFWKAAKAGGVKPIIGTEAYITPRTHRSDKTRVRWGDGGGDDVSGAGSYTHMTMFAENTTGMHNLFRLSSKASLEGYYFKPRMDIELLQEYHEGIIATTGCPSGRSRRACASASTTKQCRRLPTTATSSARRTTSPRSWTTASRSNAGS